MSTYSLPFYEQTQEIDARPYLSELNHPKPCGKWGWSLVKPIPKRYNNSITPKGAHEADQRRNPASMVQHAGGSIMLKGCLSSARRISVYFSAKSINHSGLNNDLKCKTGFKCPGQILDQNPTGKLWGHLKPAGTCLRASEIKIWPS